MANTSDKRCHSCGLFCDCWKYHGVQSPPCAKLVTENVNILQHRMGTITAIGNNVSAVVIEVDNIAGFVLGSKVSITFPIVHQT